MMGTRRSTRNLEVPLERDELLEIGKEAGQMEHDIILLEAEKKRMADIFKGEIEDKTGKVRQLLSVLRSGCNEQTVDVEIRYHEPGKGKRSVIRLDTGECYAVEEMTQSELQEDDPKQEKLPYGARAVKELWGLLEQGVDDDSYAELERWAKSVYPREEEREVVVLWASGLKKKDIQKVFAGLKDGYDIYKAAMAMPSPASAAVSPRERLATLFELGTPTDDEVGVVLNAWGLTDPDELRRVVGYLQTDPDPAEVLRVNLGPLEGEEEPGVEALVGFVELQGGTVDETSDEQGDEGEEPGEPLAG